MLNTEAIKKLQEYGVGRRGYDDPLFVTDVPPQKYGIHDLDDEKLCHEVVKTTCHIHGCNFSGDTLLEFENHYNASHRYTCAQCKKVLPSPHLLDLHLQETHDSFFAVMALKKASYCCYIEECKEKFLTTNDRLDHCVQLHKLPKDYRFDQLKGVNKVKKSRGKAKNINTKSQDGKMEVEGAGTQTKPRHNQLTFANSKQRAFSKYTGKKFTEENEDKKETNTNMDEVMKELKDSLPT